MTEPVVLKPHDATRVSLGRRQLIYFGGSDYLRLSWHPEVRQAMADGVASHGPSACASRMTTGNLPVYGRLERELRRFFGTPTVTLTSCGYLAPMVAAQALAGLHDRVLLDERAHACLVDAALLTGLPVRRFAHRDPASLKAALDAGTSQRALVMTDGLFTHSGQVAPLRECLTVLGGRGTLLVDDAHGAGVLGERGRGSVEWAGLEFAAVVVTLTLSKAFGCYGGVVLGDERLRQRILEESRIFTGNTAVPPPSAAGVLAGLGVLRREGRERRRRLKGYIEQVKNAVRAAGGEVPDGPGPMFCLGVAREADTRRLQTALLRAGIHPPLICYPNGPCRQFFRFALSSEHTPEQIGALTQVLVRFFEEQRA